MEKLTFLLPNMRPGGAERVVLTLLRELATRGYKPDLLLAAATGELLEQIPPEVRVIDLEACRLRNVVRPLVHYLREEGPTALHVSMWPLTISAIIAKLITGVATRVVVSDHAILSRQYAGRRGALAMLALTVRLLYPRADSRIVVSEGAAEDLARLSGLSREKLAVIANPVEPPRCGSSADASEIWSSEGARILTVGALKGEKNHHLLIEALAILRKRRAVQLLILGEGALRSALERQISDLELRREVSLPGYVADPYPVLLSADLFVLSSDHEGFGNVLVEALYAGLRIVSTDCVGGPRMILGDGKYGRLVPCGDAHALAEAMDAALSDPIDSYRQKGRAREISGPKIVDQYLALMLGRE